MWKGLQVGKKINQKCLKYQKVGSTNFKTDGSKKPSVIIQQASYASRVKFNNSYAAMFSNSSTRAAD